MTHDNDCRLRVAALPLDSVIADVEANIAAVEKAMEQLPRDTDILVLPELFSTGFTDEADVLLPLAEDKNGRTMTAVRALAARHNCAIAGSYLALDGEQVFNRAFFVEPSGEESFYDKRHLFSLSSEASMMQRGQRHCPAIRFRRWNIGMVVCYDVRFPAWCRNTDCRYDILLVPANWPQSRAYAWEHLLIARAIENQTVVVGANRSGSDKFGTYDGLSFIFDCLGKSVGVQDGPFVVADLSRARQDSFRQAFPVWKDADSFTIDIK